MDKNVVETILLYELENNLFQEQWSLSMPSNSQ